MQTSAVKSTEILQPNSNVSRRKSLRELLYPEHFDLSADQISTIAVPKIFQAPPTLHSKKPKNTTSWTGSKQARIRAKVEDKKSRDIHNLESGQQNFILAYPKIEKLVQEYQRLFGSNISSLEPITNSNNKDLCLIIPSLQDRIFLVVKTIVQEKIDSASPNNDLNDENKEIENEFEGSKLESDPELLEKLLHDPEFEQSSSFSQEPLFSDNSSPYQIKDAPSPCPHSSNSSHPDPFVLNPSLQPLDDIRMNYGSITPEEKRQQKLQKRKEWRMNRQKYFEALQSNHLGFCNLFQKVEDEVINHQTIFPQTQLTPIQISRDLEKLDSDIAPSLNRIIFVIKTLIQERNIFETLKMVSSQQTGQPF